MALLFIIYCTIHNIYDNRTIISKILSFTIFTYITSIHKYYFKTKFNLFKQWKWQMCIFIYICVCVCVIFIWKNNNSLHLVKDFEQNSISQIKDKVLDNLVTIILAYAYYYPIFFLHFLIFLKKKNY